MAEDLQCAISDGIHRGKCHSDKQAVFVRLELIEEDIVLYKETRLAVPPAN